ncbi:regulatory protein NPR5-like [Pyrus ussuriensis x Pyrus communis]|uniref:Regulatory protein NPR5-like n=1 Tax=Pyrus ussuriensis x Pyrus communis TaxID=2448454 RepID=A0A5N5G3M1_9ROSA|nr:regulatory protein NPR5-like [Pyrus ussuriensis x Pyrus communis]
MQCMGWMEIGDAGQSFFSTSLVWPVISFVFIDLSNFIAYLLCSIYFLVPHPPLIIPLCILYSHYSILFKLKKISSFHELNQYNNSL